jgi:hypothetical protein
MAEMREVTVRCEECLESLRLADDVKRHWPKPHDASLSIRPNTASFYCYTLPGNRPRSNPAAATYSTVTDFARLRG